MNAPKYHFMSISLAEAENRFSVTQIAGSEEMGQVGTDMLSEAVQVDELPGLAKFRPDLCGAVIHKGTEAGCGPCGQKLNCPVFKHAMSFAAADAIVSIHLT